MRAERGETAAGAVTAQASDGIAGEGALENRTGQITAARALARLLCLAGRVQHLERRREHRDDRVTAQEMALSWPQ